MGGGDSKPLSEDDPTIVTVFSLPVVNAEEIQKLLINHRSELTQDAIELFQEARKEVTNEKDLYHATIQIFCDDHIYKIVSGEGTNEIIVQRDGQKIMVNWTNKSFKLAFEDKFFDFLKFLKDSASVLITGALLTAPKLALAFI